MGNNTVAWWDAISAYTVHDVPCCRAIFELGEYATLGRFRGSAGMTRANLKDADNGMTDTWVILAVEWIIFMAAALYLEQVSLQHSNEIFVTSKVCCWD